MSALWPRLISLAFLCACGSDASKAPVDTHKGLPSIEWAGGLAAPVLPSVGAGKNTVAEPPVAEPPVQEPPAQPPPQPPPPTPPAEAPGFDFETLRINQLQMRGTHNSYHLRTPTNPYISWHYDMPPLAEQFGAYGIRAVELDVHAEGDQFTVYHIDGDAMSTCPLLATCLSEIRAWSRANPTHAPIVVFLETRETWTIDNLMALEALIGANFPDDMLYRPDDLTGGQFATVLEAMQARGWPTLAAMRGQIIVALMTFQHIRYYYTYEGYSLHGRQMFVVESLAGARNAVVLAFDYPVEQEAAIQDVVRRGYLVRTRLDNYPGKINDPWATYRAALRGGAQLLLTDFPNGSSYFPGYDSSLPGGAFLRCNPVTAPPECL